MLWHIVQFEVNYYRKQPIFLVMAAIFFLLPFFITLSPNISIGLPGNILVNSPFAIMTLLQTMSFLGLFVCINYATNPVLRDFEYKNAELIFCTQVRKHEFVFGRFLACFMFTVLILSASVLGVMLAEYLPIIDAERLGAFNPKAYWFSFLVIVVPNLFIVASIMFLVATLTRSLMAVYASALGLITLFSIVFALVDPSQLAIMAIFEPFAMSALAEVTRYWTPHEQNALVPEFSGTLLYNRALWMFVAASALVISYKLFPFSVELTSARHNKKRLKSVNPMVQAKAKVNANSHQISQESQSFTDKKIVKAMPIFNHFTAFTQLLQFAKFEAKQVLKDKLFMVMLVLGIFNVCSSLVASTNDVFGIDSYPTMLQVLNIINGAFTLPLIVVVIFYAAELVHREKQTGVASFIHALPFPNWTILLAKVAALFMVISAMLLAVIATGILFQLANGYFDISVYTYVTGLFFYGQISIWLFAIFAIFVQILLQQKYIAMFVSLLYVVAQMLLPQLGYDQFLYLLAIPSPSFSVFTGFSLGFDSYVWHAIYWGFFTLVLFIVAQLFWQRSNENQWRSRWSLAKQRFTGHLPKVAAIAMIGFMVTGSFIYYNTNVLNTHYTLLDLQQLQADYEHNYKSHESLAQPAITAVSVDVAIYPKQREALIKGSYTLVNEEDTPIKQLHVSLLPDISVTSIKVAGATLSDSNLSHGHFIYTFDQALLPGQKTSMAFDVAWRTPGFVNRSPVTELLSNGTFFDNARAFPGIGYNANVELQQNTMRHRYGLSDVERIKAIDDKTGHNTTMLGSRRVMFEATVSTSLDQIAVAPGYLEKQWVEGDRRFFSYKMDTPIWNFVSFMSADYQVARDKWQDVDIEVYYKHGVNVDRMIASTKKSMTYFSENFSPYQYRQFRIFEFPNMRGRFAQSFANTVPFSESIGFTTDVRNPQRVDLPFYVTAHELAHQWWAHQVAGANVQGSTMLIESLAQYSALMVMEQEYGKPYMQRFLKMELDRYLNGRGGESLQELPLSMVDNQSYIHYRKGSLAMYALQDSIGSDKVNAAIRQFLKQYAFKPAPYPTSRDLLALIREQAGSGAQALIDDLFENIIIYDLKTERANYKQLSDGRYEVTLTLVIKKYQADGQGVESLVALDDMFDVAVLGEKVIPGQPAEVLYLEKRRITQAQNTMTIIVDKKPNSAGVDPFNKMIDKIPDNNIKALTPLN